MEQASIVIRLILVAIFVGFLFQGSVLAAIVEAINNFRGGPPTPRHPLPADDGAILFQGARGLQIAHGTLSGQPDG